MKGQVVAGKPEPRVRNKPEALALRSGPTLERSERSRAHCGTPECVLTTALCTGLSQTLAFLLP